MRVEDAMERQAFAVVLSWFVRTFSDDPRIREGRDASAERRVGAERAFPWRRSEAPPAVASALAAGGVAWSDLSSDVRFALVDAAQTGSALEEAVSSPEGCRECPPKGEPRG